VELRTRRRVLLDTTPRRLGRFLALAVALHVPLTPIPALFGLLSFLRHEQDVPVLPPVTEIPLDIIDDDTGSGQKPAEPAAPIEPTAPAAGATPEAALPAEPEPAPEPKPKPKPNPKPKPSADVGAGGAPDHNDEKPSSETPKATEAPPRRPGDGIGSPVAGIGDKRVVDPNANVQVLVHTDRVRKHPLGPQIGPLLRNVYQWRDFFGPTSIDPIRDIDRMLLVGPQLRDSSQVVAILQFNIPQERVRTAIDTLVARDPEGHWDDGAVPVAHAHADRGERAFVLPTSRLLIVTPPTALESAKKFRRGLPGPKDDELAVAQLATPWRAFIGMPVAIPKSIKSATLRLSPMPDGGVTIDILAHDETEQLASSDAQALTQALTAATSLDLGLFGSVLFGSSQKKFIEKGSFDPDGADIRGEIVLTRQQTETLLELAGSFVGGRPTPRPRPQPAPSFTAPTAPQPAPASSQ
jgi:hypothetical protein